MSAIDAISAQSTAAFRGALAHHWAVVLATARSSVQRSNAYLIDRIRWPLGAFVMYAVWRITYAVSGRGEVGGANTSGFLLIGMFGVVTWTATVWSGGSAIEFERYEGTVGALFLSPASRVAVLAGYGIGGFAWLLPSYLLVAVLGAATGARLAVADPLALAAAALALIAASLGMGFAMASLFVLSRRANLLSNFVQLPVNLLAGFLVPRESLPGWLRPLSDAIPASQAMDALRASALNGATLRDVGGQVGLALAVAVVYALVGALSLRRVEYAAKRSGQLDLY
jgi:ABC-type multidrug transport system permease subunit